MSEVVSAGTFTTQSFKGIVECDLRPERRRHENTQINVRGKWLLSSQPSPDLIGIGPEFLDRLPSVLGVVNS
jgi:hypothetical protein